jgi:hypothetical protein
MSECRNITITVDRVLDSGNKKISLEHAELVCYDIPHMARCPYKFVSAHSIQSEAIITDLAVDRIEDCEKDARVRCKATVPLQVIFYDADGCKHTCKSQTTVALDVILCIPEPSMFPFEIKAYTTCNCPNGHFVCDNVVECTQCISVIIKVITQADVIVPCYGYSNAPCVKDYDRKECERFFSLPTFPRGRQ